MNDIDLLRDAMLEHGSQLRLRDDAAARALTGARRATRARQASGAVAGAAVAGVAVLAVSGAVTLPGVPSSVGAAADDRCSAFANAITVETAPAPASGGTTDKEQGKVSRPAPAALLEIGLPAQLPGFPARRLPDGIYATDQDGPTWVATFLLGQQSETSGNGCAEQPQATVLVGEFPLPDVARPLPSDGQADGEVVATPTIQGHQATYAENGDSQVLFFSSGTYSVVIYGWGSDQDQLTAVGEALTGLR